MTGSPRPEFEASDQQLDGSYRPPAGTPAEASGPAEPVGHAEPIGHTEPAAGSRWPGSLRRPRILAAAAVVVAAACGAAWALGGDEQSGPARFTTLPEPCLLVPGTTLERHVPDSGPPVAGESDTSETERYASCEWAEPLPGAAGDETAAHQLTVAVRLHLDGVAPAKSEYEGAWTGARHLSGTSRSASGSLHAEAPALVDIGDEAFTSYTTLTGPLGRSGTATTTVRLRNAVITVRFRETITPPGKDASPKGGASRAPDEDAARAGAEEAAEGVADALANCKDCLSD